MCFQSKLQTAVFEEMRVTYQAIQKLLCFKYGLTENVKYWSCELVKGFLLIYAVITGLV